MITTSKRSFSKNKLNSIPTALFKGQTLSSSQSQTNSNQTYYTTLLKQNQTTKLKTKITQSKPDCVLNSPSSQTSNNLDKQLQQQQQQLSNSSQKYFTHREINNNNKIENLIANRDKLSPKANSFSVNKIAGTQDVNNIGSNTSVSLNNAQKVQNQDQLSDQSQHKNSPRCNSASHLKIHSLLDIKNKSKATGILPFQKNMPIIAQHESKIENESKGFAVTCINHSNKKGKYIIQESQDEMKEENLSKYCSKCAINLAQDGYRLIEISKQKISTNQNFQLFNTQPIKESDFDQTNIKNDALFFNETKKRYSGSDIRYKNEEKPTVLMDEKSIEYLRKAEIEDFLGILSKIKSKNIDVCNKFLKRRDEFRVFFNRQADKIQSVFDELVVQLNEERNHLLKKITDNSILTLEEVDSNVKQIQGYLKEIDLIQNDVEKNIDNILHKMQLQPLKSIISKYSDKFKEYDEFILKVFSVSIQVFKYDKDAFIQSGQSELLQNYFSCLNKLLSLKSTSLLKKDSAVSLTNVDKTLKPSITEGQQQQQHQQQQNNNRGKTVYISFENKEIFETALKSSSESDEQINTYNNEQKNQSKTHLNFRSWDKDRNKSDDDNQQFMFNTYHAGVQDNTNTQNQINSSSYKPYSSFNQTFNSFTNNQTQKKQNNNQNHTVQNILTNSSNIDLTSRSKGTTNENETTNIFSSLKQSKQKDPYSQQSGLQYTSNEQSKKSPQVSSINFQFQSPNIIKNSESNKIGSTSSNIQASSVEGSGNKMKYLNLLEKVVTNQNNTNTFYSNILKSVSNKELVMSPMIGTSNTIYLNSENGLDTVVKATKSETESIKHSKSCNQDDNDIENDQNINKNESENVNKENQHLISSSKVENFFQYIENKLNDDGNKFNLSQTNSNYQKMLFNSPHFKEDQNSYDKIQNN